MKKAIKAKESLVTNVLDKINSSKSFIIFEYAGLTAEDMSSLRKEMLKTKATLAVFKNNILTRALTKSSVKDFGTLVGPNAIAFGQEDEIAPLKLVCNLIKENEFIKVKGSFIEGKFLGVEETKAIAALPNREGMYSMLLSCLTSPIRSILYGLKAVSETKTN